MSSNNGSGNGGGGSGSMGYVGDPYMEALQADAPRFFHEASAEVVVGERSPRQLGLLRNQVELNIALAVVPESLETDVENHIALVSTALGVSRSVAVAYVDIGIELGRMPRLLEVLRARRHLTFAHLRAIALATAPVPDDGMIVEIESRLAEFVLPRKEGEVLRGVRSLMKFLQKVIADIEPLLRPRSLPGEEESISSLEAACGLKPGESIGFANEGPLTKVNMELDSLRAFELQETLRHIAADKACSYAEALSHLVHGTVDTKVILNLYCPLTEEKPRTAWVGGHGWINEIATAYWLQRVTSVRIMADETVEGYTPSQRQRAYVQGRDGTCSFPGCTVDATKCDIDHIEPYNHTCPEQGGATDTHNLHCLCRRHHNLKTAGLWNVTRHHDGMEEWGSVATGEKIISFDDGPLAGHGRFSFDVRRTRIGHTLREYNERREKLYAESKRLVARSRHGVGESASQDNSEDCPF